MKGKLLMPFLFVLGILTVCGPMFAHHGSAAFGRKVVILKQVTVVRFRWANPHTLVLFDVKTLRDSSRGDGGDISRY